MPSTPRRLRVLLVLLVASAGIAVWYWTRPTPPFVPPPSAALPTTVEGAFGAALVAVVRMPFAPVDIQNAADGSGRLFVVDKSGRIFVLRDGVPDADPFLDIRDRVDARSSERGLLGVAFAPDFATSGRLYVDYTGRRGQTVIARFSAATPAAASIDPSTEEVLLEIQQPFPNHNGGQLRFGPDGMLWIGTGDGGGAGDPNQNAVDPTSMLGKMLRIDVSGPSVAAEGTDRVAGTDPPAAAGSAGPIAAYRVPAGNRLPTAPGEHPEIWAVGLRNPWRWAFDLGRREIVIADVGQNKVEEISVASVDATGGLDFGWDRLEGTHCFEPDTGCDASGTVVPAYEYLHLSGSCSVTGGIVYRGQVRDIRGGFLFADVCGGWIRTLRPNNEATRDADDLFSVRGAMFVAFGEDERGDAYVADLHGVIFRIENLH
ncbi:MAG: PQQ-dependent sugar dehydrogenase [Myxococcales bacterium]|nr:PQQ-dependent sugar dehydrogenase [Myxococcales bacterium]MCB9519965.1 PQQ-dependent sugar dehydrogenase [Myxococcales bacterium]MCB9532512.1 PQQ-dependent sugar dehydrogenase [Myxococcales bacterium]MCB9533124.1 PQQ-dependent sugar dehydrogenase [Myxococcales bacterium]